MPRKRAVHVCAPCHRRKIRCDLDLNKTPPCSRCVEVGEACSLRARKAYSPRRSRPRRKDTPTSEVEVLQEPSNALLSPKEQAEVVASVVTIPTATERPLFIGMGGYAEILRSITTTDHVHLSIPAEMEKSLAQEDLAYLQQKGCFSLPPDSDILIRAYFDFVHPSFPILDGSTFLQSLTKDGINSINLLLLWSIFSVSASYTPRYAHRSIREVFNQRATLLFHLTPESNKLILIQSALLISFWFAAAEDIKQSWFWTSIAFSVAQAFGLHRDNNNCSTEERETRRNLWRACVYRDARLAFSMGRPLRLNLADSNIPEHATSDRPFRDIRLPGMAEDLYAEDELAQFLDTWRKLTQTSACLREILTAGQFSQSDRSPHTIRLPTPSSPTHADHLSPRLLFAIRHLHLHQNAALIAHHRQHHSQNLSQALLAASATTSIIQVFLSDTPPCQHVAPYAVPLVIPPLLVYLDCLRSNSLVVPKEDVRRVFEEIYLRFLEAIGEVYPSAGILRRLLGGVFERAWAGTRGGEGLGGDCGEEIGGEGFSGGVTGLLAVTGNGLLQQRWDGHCGIEIAAEGVLMGQGQTGSEFNPLSMSSTTGLEGQWHCGGLSADGFSAI